MKYFTLLILILTSCGISDQKIDEKKATADFIMEADKNAKFIFHQDLETKKIKEPNSLKMSDEVYEKLKKGWNIQNEYNPELGTKILQSLPKLNDYKVFTIEQFWDLCSTFEYAIVVENDSSFVNAFPYSIIESGCEADIEISTEILNDSIIEQVKKYTVMEFKVDTVTNLVEDIYRTQIEKIQIALTNQGSLDTLSYFKEDLTDKK